jgi:hypothetical protein
MLTTENVDIIEGLLPGYIDIQTPDMSQYVADQIFPQVQVARVSGNYPVIGSQDAKPQDITYSGFGKPVSFSFNVSSGSFKCEPKWIDIDVPYDVLKSAGDNEIDMATLGAAKLSAIHADVKEAAINTILTNNTNFVGNATPSPLWDAADSTPIKDIAGAVSVVTKASRVRPNTLLMNLEVFMALLSNASMREIFNETSFIDQGRLRTYLSTAIPGITKLIVAGSSNDTTAEGLAASNAWGLADDCWILYVPDSVTFGTPSYGVQPIYEIPLAAEVIDDRKHRQVIYRAGQRYDLIVPNKNYGYRLAQVIS